VLVTESKVLLPDLATGLGAGIFGVSRNSLLEMEDESGVGIVLELSVVRWPFCTYVLGALYVAS
jgi:hypothetical protein